MPPDSLLEFNVLPATEVDHFLVLHLAKGGQSWHIPLAQWGDCATLYAALYQVAHNIGTADFPRTKPLLNIGNDWLIYGGLRSYPRHRSPIGWVVDGLWVDMDLCRPTPGGILYLHGQVKDQQVLAACDQISQYFDMPEL